jgi:hypothetical protein
MFASGHGMNKDIFAFNGLFIRLEARTRWVLDFLYAGGFAGGCRTTAGGR